jgi:hypothetical protein
MNRKRTPPPFTPPLILVVSVAGLLKQMTEVGFQEGNDILTKEKHFASLVSYLTALKEQGEAKDLEQLWNQVLALVEKLTELFIDSRVEATSAKAHLQTKVQVCFTSLALLLLFYIF